MIGVFDSGLGGLSVLREIVRLMPEESLTYLADQAHVPYGSRSLLEVRRLTVRAVEWLIGRGCNPIVIACNTASAAALHHLRSTYPDRCFVGMEPAVKPAAAQTRTGRIGVLATPATFQGELFASVVARYASDVRVIEQTCPGWVELVERGTVPANNRLPADEQQIGRRRVADCVSPLLEAGVDALVLGCTHFPFLAPWIDEVLASRSNGGGQAITRLIDPSPAVAKQTMRVHDMIAGEAQRNTVGTRDAAGRHAGNRRREFWTTGDPNSFDAVRWVLLPDSRETISKHLAWSESDSETAALIL